MGCLGAHLQYSARLWTTRLCLPHPACAEPQGWPQVRAYGLLRSFLSMYTVLSIYLELFKAPVDFDTYGPLSHQLFLLSFLVVYGLPQILATSQTAMKLKYLSVIGSGKCSTPPSSQRVFLLGKLHIGSKIDSLISGGIPGTTRQVK